jgi:hypothetical protein
MESTLYPKITNKLGDVRQLLVKVGAVTVHGGEGEDNAVATYSPDTLEIVGTVKLHGTHADIVVHADNSITYQSRNQQTLTKQRDNCGFVAAMEGQATAILRIRDRYCERFRELNPATPIDTAIPLILAGEWIGQGIQKKVAITQLPRTFVTISASINGTWLPDTDYADIHDEEHNIYHISRGGFYHTTLNLNRLPESLKTLNEFTAKVEKECPFAATFGIHGKGEGIVWKFSLYPSLPTLWFKIKAAEFLATSSRSTPADPARIAKMGKAAAFAERVVTEVRLEQAWDYLAEMGITRDKKAIGQFLKWICNDVQVEERTEIEVGGIDGKVLNKEIGVLAKPWYFERVSIEDLGGS